MNRHMRRALQAKGRKADGALDKATQAIQSLTALPTALQDVQAVLAAIEDMKRIVTDSVQEVAAMEHRLARQEYVMSRLVQGVYDNTLFIFGVQPNETIDWDTKRREYEDEFDKLRAADPAVTET